MRINLSGLKDFDPQISTQLGERFYKRGWLLGKVLHESESEQRRVQLVVIDPKAARMFELYARQRTSFAWGNMRAYLILLVWLANIQIKVNVKRAFDLLVVLSVLPFVLPIMLITALAIRLDSSGAVIFRQERVGKWGRRFTCYKFRSMYNGADSMKKDLIAANEADEVVFKISTIPG